jgi:predicted MFS family arabinose efflux permease
MIEVKEKLWNSNYIKVSIANFMLFFAFYLLTPLLPLYMSEQFHATKDVIGIVLSGYTVLALLFRPFSGYIVDSFPRKQVLMICFFLFFIFFAGYIVAGSLLLFAVIRTLHGGPFGAVTVANSTVAIDVLPSSRRTEGIGYYGLSNNVSMAIGPTIAIYIYNFVHSFEVLFWMAFIVAGLGLVIDATVKLKSREFVKPKSRLSLDRFLLVKGTLLGINLILFGFCFGVLSNYLAIYGKEVLGITSGTGTYFMLLAVGLILSRLEGASSLRKGKITYNASVGVGFSLLGYILFVTCNNYFGYYGSAILIGLGNGHMFPAFQNMFINLAEHNQRGTANSTLLISWDIGMGIGILVGGVVAEYYGYTVAFWTTVVSNAAGVAMYFITTRGYYLRNKLR